MHETTGPVASSRRGNQRWLATTVIVLTGTALAGGARADDLHTIVVPVELSEINQSATLHPEPANEQYRVVLGRDAKPDEVTHFAKVLAVLGQPVAWYAPYNKNGIMTFNADAFKAGGDAWGVFIRGLYSTNLGRLPTADELFAGLAMDRNARLTRLAAKLNSGRARSWGVFEDIYRHQLARSPDSNNPNDVALQEQFAAGSLNVNDVIHQVRATKEYRDLNGVPGGTAFISRQPHLPGEFIRQIYRLLLGREPSHPELQSALSAYPPGFEYSQKNEDGDPRLSELATKLLRGP